jgi:hypothetical protein
MDAELVGGMVLDFSSILDCEYEGVVTGTWQEGSAFEVSGSLSATGSTFLCGQLTSTDDLALSIEFLD